MNPCVRLLLLIVGVLLSGYTFFGRIIYGGVYWGQLKYWNDGNNAADHIWLIALLQWIFGIVLPIGSFIVNCMIIHSTRPSNCNPYHLQFPEFLYDVIQRKYPDFPSQSYFDERCAKPRRLFISFLVCGLVGSIIVTIAKVGQESDNSEEHNQLFQDEK